MLGREINLPLDVMVEQPPSATSEQCYVQYVEWVKKATQRSDAVAHEHSKKAALRQKRNYDKRVSLNEMQEDDWVWYFYPPKAKQKLGQGWTGPYLVTHKVSDVLYQIQASSLSRPKIVHVDNLRPYEAEIMPTDWRHLLSTDKTNSDDKFDKDEREGCDGDCDTNESQRSDQNLKGISRFGRVRRPPKYLSDYC